MELNKNYQTDDILKEIKEYLYKYRAQEQSPKTKYELYKNINYLLNILVEEERKTLPVDMKKIVNKLGIKLEYKDLNIGGGFNVNRVIGRLHLDKEHLSDDGKYNKIIQIEKNSSHPEQNMAIARQLAHYIFRMDDNNYWQIDEFSSMPLMPIDGRDLLCDVFAYICLLPMDSLFQKIIGFVQNKVIVEKGMVETKELLEHLTIQSEMPMYDFFNGYQCLRNIFSYVYNDDELQNGDSLDKKNKELCKKYQVLFR